MSTSTPVERPRIWLPVDREKYRKGLARYTSDPAVQAAWWEVLEAIYSTLDEGDLSPQSLAVLRAAMESRWRQVWEEAGRRLNQLAHYYPSAADLLRVLAVHSKATVRLRVVQSIWTSAPPFPLLREIVSAGLKDPSAKVRHFSADRARHERLHDLLPEVEAAYQAETDAKAKDSIYFSLRLLRDGYFLEESSDGRGYNLVVQGDDGTIGGPFVPSSDCSPERVRQLVADFQREHQVATSAT